MQPEVRFSRTAQKRLIAIAQWTVETFGQTQAETYRDGLIEKLNDVATGLTPTRSLETLTGVSNHTRYETAKFGRHVMIITRQEAMIVVIDIFHDAQDLRAFKR